MFKNPVICCMLGEYDPSYSCLFCSSHETVEMDFLFVKYLFRYLNLRNSNNETYQTVNLSPLVVV